MKKGFYINFLVCFLFSVNIFASGVQFPLTGPQGQKIWGIGPLGSIRFIAPNRIATWNSLGIFLWDRITENLINANFDTDLYSNEQYGATNQPFFLQRETSFYYMSEKDVITKQTLNQDGTWAKKIYNNEKYGATILSLSVGDTILLTADEQKNCKVWDTATMTEKVKLNGCKKSSDYHSYITPNGSYLVQFDSVSPVPWCFSIWSLSTGETLYEEAFSDLYNGWLRFSSDEKYCVLSYIDKNYNSHAELRSLPDGKILYSFPESESENAVATMLDPVLAVSPQDETVLFLRETSIYKLSLQDLREEKIYDHRDTDAGFSMNACFLDTPDEILINDSGSIIKWNSKTLKLIKQYDLPKDSSLKTIDNKMMALSNMPNDPIFYYSQTLYDLETENQKLTFNGLSNNSFITFSDDAKRMFNSRYDNESRYNINVCDMEEFEPRNLLADVGGSVLNACSPQGAGYLAYSLPYADGDRIMVWDVNESKVIFKIDREPEDITVKRMTLSDQGGRLFVSYFNRKAVYDVKANEEIINTERIEGITPKSILASIMTTDGEKLICMDDKKIFIVDIGTGSTLRSFPHDLIYSKYCSLFISPKSDILLLVDHYKDAKITWWSLSTEKQMGSCTIAKPLYMGIPFPVAFSDDEKYVVIPGASLTAGINLETQTITKIFPSKFAGFYSCAFNSGKQSFFFSNLSGYIVEWPLSSLVERTGISDWLQLQ